MDSGGEDAKLVELGQRLRARREALGLKVSGVETRAGVSRTTIWTVERGQDPETRRPQRPGRNTLEPWLNVLEFSPQEKAELLALAGYTYPVVAGVPAQAAPGSSQSLSGAAPSLSTAQEQPETPEQIFAKTLELILDLARLSPERRADIERALLECAREKLSSYRDEDNESVQQVSQPHA